MKCPYCGEDIGREVVSVERRYFRLCGDHDESVIVSVQTYCSMPCAAAHIGSKDPSPPNEGAG